MTIIEKAKAQAEKQGWEFISSSRLNHPDDKHLLYTIVKLESAYGETYATHLFNESLGGFNYGKYDIRTLEEAKQDLTRRVNL